MAAGNYTTTSHKPYEGEMLTDEQLAEYVAIAHMRNKFEQHFKLTLRQARRTKDGIGYQNPDIQARWEGWQASITTAPQEFAPVATVLWHEGEKIIDGSMAFMAAAPLGTELYAKQPAQEPETCKWVQEDAYDAANTYQAACGAHWTFMEGGPMHNRVKFCHCCGKPVKEVAAE